MAARRACVRDHGGEQGARDVVHGDAGADDVGQRKASAGRRGRTWRGRTRPGKKECLPIFRALSQAPKRHEDAQVQGVKYPGIPSCVSPGARRSPSPLRLPGLGTCSPLPH